MIKAYNGDNCHEILTKKTVGKLAFDESCDYPQWKAAVGEKLRESVSIPLNLPRALRLARVVIWLRIPWSVSLNHHAEPCITLG